MRAKPVPYDRSRTVRRAQAMPMPAVHRHDAERAAIAVLQSSLPVPAEGGQRIGHFVSLAAGWMSLAAGYAFLVWIVGLTG